MTAEIAVLNKSAVALAADSAVTIQKPGGQKIFNTVNKLFMLSKHFPVGVMVFGRGDLQDVPWETIIKEYRYSYGGQGRDTLREYAEHLIGFLDSKNPFFPEARQEHFFTQTTGTFFRYLRSQLDDWVRDQTEEKGRTVTESDIVGMLESVLESELAELMKKDALSHLPGNHGELVVKKYTKPLAEVRKRAFGKLPLSDKAEARLVEISQCLFQRDRFRGSASGVVIAGFGEKEYFPSLHSYSVDGIVLDRLKYKLTTDGGISYDRRAWIVPFAQAEMVHTFMRGVDPDILSYVLRALNEMLVNKYPSHVLDLVPSLGAEERQALDAKLKETGKGILDELGKDVERYSWRENVDPVITAVASLPKDELALMAETLVNLTSFKRRVSMDAETVGGPIDVAVISKGDGFIWIKRKHYFSTELNPCFNQNYFRKPEGQEDVQ